MVLTQFELRGWEGLHVDPWAAWLLLSRNVLLVLLLVVLVRELQEPHHVVGLGLAFALPSSASMRVRRSATSCASRTFSSVSREITVE